MEDGEVISSNAVESVNSHIRRFMRKHNGFPYNRVWLALDEFVYHRNNSGSRAAADVRKLMMNVAEYGPKDIANGEYHSLHYDYLSGWKMHCTDDSHYFAKECDCAEAEIEEEDEPPKFNCC